MHRSANIFLFLFRPSTGRGSVVRSPLYTTLHRMTAVSINRRYHCRNYINPVHTHTHTHILRFVRGTSSRYTYYKVHVCSPGERARRTHPLGALRSFVGSCARNFTTNFRGPRVVVRSHRRCRQLINILFVSRVFSPPQLTPHFRPKPRGGRNNTDTTSTGFRPYTFGFAYICIYISYTRCTCTYFPTLYYIIHGARE